MKSTVDFLRRIYGNFDSDEVFVITHIKKHDLIDGVWVKKKRAEVTTFKYKVSDIPSIYWETHLKANNSENQVDIYYGEATRKASFLNLPGSARGGASDCAKSMSITTDFDFAHESAHAADLDKHPKDIDEVEYIVELGPAPSIWIDSGYGGHAYWLFDKPIDVSGMSKKGLKDHNKWRKRVHDRYKYAMEAANDGKGWQFDATYTLDRVWRLPGFDNWKVPDSPSPVYVLYGVEEEPERYAPEDLEPFIVARKEKKASEVELSMPVAQADSVEGLPETLKAYVQKNYDDSLALSRSSDRADRSKGKELREKSDMVKNMLAGDSIAEKGGRDNALTKVCGIICRLTSDIEEFTESDLKTIVVGIMGPSLEEWVDDSEDDTDIDREISKAVEKLTRIKEKDLANQDHGLAALAKALSKKKSNFSSPLQEESLEVSGEDEETQPSKEELLSCGLIIYDEYVYVWDWRNDRYFSKSIKNKDYLRAVLRQCWPEEDSSCPFKHSYYDEEGNSVEHPLPYLQRVYQQAAESCFYSYQVNQTVFDVETKTFIINPAPPRYSEPKFCESIDEWLKLLGGKDHYEILCDYLAALVRLDRPCAVLYLDGPPGCGKSLFGLGCSQLWSDSVPSYESVSGNFNEFILQGPQSLIDEGMDQTGKNASMILRRLVVQGHHRVNKKNGPLLKLEGYLRFIIAANNDQVLMSGREERLSTDDARAMSERINYILIDNDRAKDYLIKNNKNRTLTNSWIAGGDFARHVLWLAANRELEDKGRLIVQGRGSNMTEKFLFQGDERQTVLETLVLFCSAPAKHQANRQEGTYAAEIGNGETLVNVKGLKDMWKTYSEDIGINHAHLLRHIKALSYSPVALKIRSGNKTLRYWPIDPERLMRYSDTHDIGDVDRIREFSKRDTKLTMSMTKAKAKAIIENIDDDDEREEAIRVRNEAKAKIKREAKAQTEE